jgi:hypothetical protein
LRSPCRFNALPFLIPLYQYIFARFRECGLREPIFDESVQQNPERKIMLTEALFLPRARFADPE